MPVGLIDEPSLFERPDTLKPYLNKVTPWTAEVLQIDLAWLKGRSLKPHRDIGVHGAFELLEFLNSQTHFGSFFGRFTLYVFKSDDRPIHMSAGGFSVVLEEHFKDLDGNEEHGVYRYFHVSRGAYFEHPGCLLHLMCILALAHVHKIQVWGRVMDRSRLIKLDDGNGFIPELWRDRVAKHWYPEDAIWTGLGSPADWVLKWRPELDHALVRAGMNSIAEVVQQDRKRLERGAL
ncbi:hypothetical protein D9M71_434440 [compost metagenome]